MYLFGMKDASTHKNIYYHITKTENVNYENSTLKLSLIHNS